MLQLFLKELKKAHNKDSESGLAISAAESSSSQALSSDLAVLETPLSARLYNLKIRYAP